MPHVLMIFIDGIGLGTNDPARNPFAALDCTLGSDIPIYLPHNAQSKQAMIIPTDACLGITGLPQSATGQSALLSGVNAASLIGRHLPAYPNQALADLLSEHGIFRWCQTHGFSSTFSNGFRKEYWQAVESGKRRHSATTLSVLGAHGQFRDEQDFAEGLALYHDITGHTLRLMGRDIPLLTPEAAGQRLVRISQNFDFTLFEYFITDVVGHRQQWDSALMLLQDLEPFMQSILQSIDLEQTAVMITSDHGNFEDFSIKGHTYNPVPTILYGPLARSLAPKIHSILDIVPAIQTLLKT
jgi:2,3-bisphosphoglycerate-independent phosphoglycerate mutase